MRLRNVVFSASDVSEENRKEMFYFRDVHVLLLVVFRLLVNTSFNDRLKILCRG